MIIDIALGIVLAVIILRLLPLLAAGAVAIIVVCLGVALIGALAWFVVKDFGELVSVAAVVAAFVAISWALAKLGDWLQKHSRFNLGDVIALALAVPFALLMLAAIWRGLREFFETGWNDSLSSSVLGSLLALAIMGGLVAVLVQRIKLRPRPAPTADLVLEVNTLATAQSRAGQRDIFTSSADSSSGND